MKYDIEKIKKFVNDKDWVEVEKIINNYIEPLKDVMTIKSDLPAEEVKAEVKTRQRAYIQLKTFLEDVKIISGGEENKNISFK